MCVGYKYDVFISLVHNKIVLRWLDEIFMPLFEHHLLDELGNVEEVKLYIARKAISGGMYWPDELAHSHARSKTMLALLSRPYRYRPWCQVEFSMMRAREERTNIRRETRNGLIIPVFIHDGEDEEYKVILDGLQPIDLVRPKRLVSICMAPQCEDANLLDNRIHEIAVGVARAIKVAPKYCDDWQQMNCEAFLSLFQRYQGPDTQSVVPGRE